MSSVTLSIVGPVVCGRAGQIKPEWVKKGATVMNVGTTFRPETKELVPDVDPRVKQVSEYSRGREDHRGR